MCKADDTPMPSLLPVNGAGEGQVMKCKNLDKLFAWAKHPDRDACYRRLSEFDPPSNSIERYAFCEPDSQYYPTMSQFFEGYGKSVGGSDG
ncbi:hypothetical protein N7456_011647 [Penicillium angulare]|uniref:Uncharacterized protein n=1 Tax=Penicillium angulare TaxID=116970 RepID=A0A9W9EUE3_9EURO|nr:hypothetical protein N7456_011647 [Penicillium angulare]